jgi:heme-degrading monooxygenase HmoA
MFLVLWEFKVKPGCQKRFEKVYGPEGAWARLFQTNPHYHQTRLLHDSFHPAVYFTLDFWDSRESYEEFMLAHGAEYQAIDSAGEEWTIRERLIGQYQLTPP